MLRATGDDLACAIQYLQAENRILRSKLPDRITVTPAERTELVRLGRVLGDAIKSLISIVSPRTFLRWLHDADGRAAKPKAAPKPKPGRPATEQEIVELILRLARENSWGSTRILGELKKLGVRRIARSTVAKILRDHGLEPGPKRGPGSWHDFLMRHAATLWCSDFLSVKTVTLGGVVDMYLLFFLHLGTRRVYLAGITAQPDRNWVTQQARNFALHLDEQGLEITHLIIDHDTKYVAEFDAVLEAEGAEVKRVGPCLPDMNAHAERFCQSLRLECLDHFIFFGEDHLRHVVSHYLAHYLSERPHQGVGNRVLSESESDEESVLLPFPGGVKCQERLGGLLKHYYRAAA